MTKRNRRVWVAAALLAVFGAGLIVAGPWALREARARLSHRTIAGRIAEVAPRVGPLWRTRLDAAAIDGLPPALTLVVFKTERRLEVYAAGDTPRRLATYPIRAASGTIGPKLREGDRQVPEGVYRVEFLNPNSRFHLSLRVNYPSADDRAVAAQEGRGNLGGDIMIHGGAASIGCVAIGDDAIEEVFWLVDAVGMDRTELLFVPQASPEALISAQTPSWLAERYRALQRRLSELSPPGPHP